MSGDFELDAEFNAIMTAGKSRPALHHPINRPADGGFGPSRVHPNSERVPPKPYIQVKHDGSSRVRHSNERVLPQPDIQAKYDTIVKGFKVLEASYEESERKLAATEERLHAADIAYSALTAEMEIGRQVLHDRDTEIGTLRQYVETNTTALRGREVEIETLRRELEETKTTLAGCEERVKAIHTEVEGMLVCGICQATTTQPFSTDCRHTFCATCLFMWWEVSRATTCPTCRAVCKNAPVRDRSNGLISLVSVPSSETVEPFDASQFAMLMVELEEETQEQAREAMEIDYTFARDAGTSTNPLDLTAVWN